MLEFGGRFFTVLYFTQKLVHDVLFLAVRLYLSNFLFNVFSCHADRGLNKPEQNLNLLWEAFLYYFKRSLKNYPPCNFLKLETKVFIAIEVVLVRL